MATVNIDGDASGAIAACAAAQGAIDSLHGKTVNVDVNVRQSGGSGGMGAATQGMRDFGNAADRAGRSAQGMGDHLGRASDHMSRMAGDAGRLHSHLAAVDNVLRGGAPSSIGRSGEGMRALANHADTARQSISGIGIESSRSMGAIESGAGRAGQGLREIGAGAQASHEQVTKLADTMRKAASTFSVASSGRVGGDAGAASRLGFGDQTGMRASNFAVDSAGNVSSRLSGASKEMERFTGSAAGMGSAMGSSGREMERFGGKSSELVRQNRSLAGSFANNPMLKSFMGWMGSLDALGVRAGGALSSVGSAAEKALGSIPDVALPSARALQAVGLTAGVSALGMGALGAAVAGVGLAGVAEDFAHNSQLMHAGGEAIRGFNREFSAMKGETSAAAGPAMAGVASSMKGVGHELAQIGAANIAPVLNSVSSLGNQATAAMQKLAPSIGPATQGLTALAGAVIGAFGDSGPAVTSFANTLTKNAPQLQAFTSDVIKTAAAIGDATVSTVGGMEDMGNTMLKNEDKLTGARRDPSTGAVSSVGHWGDYDWWGTGAPKPGTPAAAGLVGTPRAVSGGGDDGRPFTPGVFDPSRPFSGTLPDGTPGTGTGEAAKPAKSPRPPGPSPDAARYSGMSAAQIYDQQYTQATGAPSGQPHYSGVGPRGPGQSVGPMPVNAAIGLGGGGLAPLNDMMRAAQSQIASGGGGMGQAVENHIQKAVHQASPAATAGGSSLGAAMTGGMAQGVTSTQTVTDTVIIKHLKKMLDSSAEVLGVHSPSDEYDYLGRMSMRGYARGFGAEDAGTFGALTAAHAQASRFSPDYAGGSAPTTISFRRKSQDPSDPSQDPSNPLLSTSSEPMMPPVNHYGPTGMSNIQAHNDRAAQLAQGRADLHAKAMANLGAVNPATGQKWQDPTKANSNPLAGTPGDPFAQKQSLGQKAGNLWQQLNQIGPQDGLPGLKKLWNDAGQSSAQGLTLGMTAHIPKVQAAGAALSVAGVTGHKKKDEQASPSAVWAGLGMNSAAGLAGGIAGGTGMVVDAVGGMAGAMQAAGSDRMLTVGYTWGENINTGVSTQIKKANYQSLGLPTGLGQAGLLGLAKTGLLSAGSGASGYKTPGNAPGVVTLPPASSGGNQTVEVHAHFHLDDQVTTISQQAMVDVLSRATGMIDLQPSA